ncbi:MAG: toprim domain-containing protein [Anaerolineales bacterium]|nr:toprim domain-containing protein [Anaerolineales bacterium]
MTQNQLNIPLLLDQIDLLALADHLGTSLKKHGVEWRGVCPIHAGADNPTAFRVYSDNDKRQRWFCYSGCNAGGDAITLVELRKNLDFKSAMQWLAEFAHISLEDIGLTPETIKAHEERMQRSQLLDLAARYYAEQLWSEIGESALAYAQSRGFNDDALRVAGWGFSIGGSGLRDHLEALNADIALATRIGLIRADGRDFTSNGDGQKASPEGWLIYPHSSSITARKKKCAACKVETWHSSKRCLKHALDTAHIQGVSYLSARAINPVDEKDKSRNLPGAEARQLYKAEVPGVREVILCEGQADAESYRQMGFSAWALCGLGYIPEGDLRLLSQRPVVYMAMDGDEEGQKKQANIASEIGPLTMLVPPLEGFKDANEFFAAQGDPDIVLETLQSSKPVIEERLDGLKEAAPHQIQELTGNILSMLKALPGELQPRYMSIAQRKLSMTRRELKSLMDGSESDNDEAPILSSIKDGRLHFLGKPLGNFAARITHELTVDDGMNLPEVRYTIDGELADGNRLQTIDVPASEFVEMKWVHRYWGARPIIYLPRGKYYVLTRAIQESSLDDMARDRVYTHTGWTEINGVRGYLSGLGMITADGFDDGVRVELGANNLQHYMLPAPPTGDASANAVSASLDFLKLGPLTVTAPLWAAMYAGPLNEIKPLYTVIWLYGPTQSGKSTVAHLALTHFGSGFIDGRQYHAPVDWMSTVTHIEGVLFRVKDAPTIIDDFAPQFQSAADSRRMHKSAHQIVRAVGNRSARGRANRDLSERRTRIPRGMVISTAELPLAGESTVGRLVYVPIARGDVLPLVGDAPRQDLDQAQEHARGGLYAQAMAAYVGWLAAHWDRAAKTYLEIIEESHKLARRGDLQNRLPDYYASLDAAQQLAVTAFHELGVLSAHDAARIADQNGQAILKVIQDQAEKIAAESPVRKFFEALDNLLQRRKIYLEPRTGAAVYIPPTGADPVGWFEPGDENVFYLNDESCLIHVRSYWSQLGEHFDTTADALRRQIAQVNGLLKERGKEKHLHVSRWVSSAGKNRRMLAVNAQKVQELYGVVIQNPRQVQMTEPERIEIDVEK